MGLTIDQISPVKPPPSTPQNDTAMGLLRAAGGFPDARPILITNARDVVGMLPDAGNPHQMQFPKSSAPSTPQTKTFPAAPGLAPGNMQIGALIIPRASRVQVRGR